MMQQIESINRWLKPMKIMKRFKAINRTLNY